MSHGQLVSSIVRGQCSEIHTAIGFPKRTGQTMHGFWCSVIKLLRNVFYGKSLYQKYTKSISFGRTTFCNKFSVTCRLSGLNMNMSKARCNTDHTPQLALKPMDGNWSAGFVNINKTECGTGTVPRFVLFADKTSTKNSGVKY